MTRQGATVTRRQFLLGLGAAASMAGLPRAAWADEVRPTVKIRPRATWGHDLPAVGPLRAERPEDVRFVVVHHTASTNDYTPDSVVDQLRSFYRYHTESKGWPDVAYNFFVDRFGRIWEGRSGSLDRPMRGSATGGSQGYALLCCFVGDLSLAPPTQAAQRAMVDLVVHLSTRYGIDVTPGAKATIVSRGSNRWAAGTSVTTSTIAAHRDMSLTACPGEYGNRFVAGALRRRVAGRAAELGLQTAKPEQTATRRKSSARHLPERPLPVGAHATRSRAPVTVPRSQGSTPASPTVAVPIVPTVGAGALVALGAAALIGLRSRSTNIATAVTTNEGGPRGSV